MDQVAFFLALIAGFLFGGAIVWLIQRNDVRQSYARARTEFNAEIAGLNERVRNRDDQLAELKKALEAKEHELAQVRAEPVQAAPAPPVDLEGALDPVRQSILRVSEQVAALHEAAHEERSQPRETERLQGEIAELRRCAAELEERLLEFSQRFVWIGQSLGQALDHHAEAALLLESRVKPGTRRLQGEPPLASLATAVEEQPAEM